MITDTPHLQALHQLYCDLTSREMKMTLQMGFQWEAWALNFTEADLRLVVKHIRKLIQAKRRWPESLRFYNLIGNTERFIEDLSEARALARRPKLNMGKEEVLRVSGRKAFVDLADPGSDHTVKQTVTPSQILAQSKALAEWREWRKANGI